MTRERWADIRARRAWLLAAPAERRQAHTHTGAFAPETANASGWLLAAQRRISVTSWC